MPKKKGRIPVGKKPPHRIRPRPGGEAPPRASKKGRKKSTKKRAKRSY